MKTLILAGALAVPFFLISAVHASGEDICLVSAPATACIANFRKNMMAPRIIPFNDLSDEAKVQISDFQTVPSFGEPWVWGSIAGESAESTGPHKSQPMGPDIADERTQSDRYLNPDHPGVQPRPPEFVGNIWRKIQHVPGIRSFEWNRPRGISRNSIPDVTQIGQTDTDEGEVEVTYTRTPQGMFPEADPFGKDAPGTNLLPTVYKNAQDRAGDEIPNTLPSSKQNPYNLHDGTPLISHINPEAPTDDLRYIFDTVFEVMTGEPYRGQWEKPDQNQLAALIKNVINQGGDPTTERREFLNHHLQWAIDILEGNGCRLQQGRDCVGNNESKVPGDRAYKGFALLNHSGHKRVKCVLPIYDKTGTRIVGGNVDIHQVWYGGRIQSDTAWVDLGWDGNCKDETTDLKYFIPPDVEWTTTYTIDTLNRGGDDFSPTAVYYDKPWEAPIVSPTPQSATKPVRIRYGANHIAMDQTFFPMEEGTRMVLKLKMATAKYFNTTYTWGWRKHPPRAQATEVIHQDVPPGLGNQLGENMCVRIDDVDQSDNIGDCQCHPRSLLRSCHERFEFEGINLQDILDKDPDHPWKNTQAFYIDKEDIERLSTEDQANFPINRIGDLAPAKRMWRAFNRALESVNNEGINESERKRRVLGAWVDARDAWLDWRDRNHLPSGFKPDLKSDLTLLYVNNTIYGELTGGGWVEHHAWRKRGDKLKVTLLNGDYFLHGYVNVDFGGYRGWENQFKPTIKTAGGGTFFTFGRFHWRRNMVPGSIGAEPAEPLDKDGNVIEVWRNGQMPDTVRIHPHRVMIEYNFEPSRRLRFYQFDPLHHDVAIYSMH